MSLGSFTPYTAAPGVIRWRPELSIEVPNGQYGARLREPRLGVMIHYDDSSTDASALAWFSDPRCKVSYNYLVLDDGRYAVIAPPEARAWHAGVCRPSSPRLDYRDANSAFLGVAAATNTRHEVTALQLLTVAWLTRRCFDREGWSATDDWRVTGHDLEAWPRGRRIDPTGRDPDNPILSLDSVRQLLPLFV